MFRIIQGNLIWILVLKKTKVKTDKKIINVLKRKTNI